MRKRAAKRPKAILRASNHALWEQFHDRGWTDLWYANPGWKYKRKGCGPRWHAGVWTGPQRDLICVKNCSTNAEAEKWLSPGGWTPDEAVALAVAKFEKLASGQQVCHRCGFVGTWQSEHAWQFCPHCEEEFRESYADRSR